MTRNKLHLLLTLLIIFIFMSIGCSPKPKFEPMKCRIMFDESNPSKALACNDFMVKNGKIRLIVVNYYGEDLSNFNLKITDSKSGNACSETASLQNFASGTQQNIQLGCSNLLSGTKFDGKIQASFVTSSGQKEYNNGFLVSRIE